MINEEEITDPNFAAETPEIGAPGVSFDPPVKPKSTTKPLSVWDATEEAEREFGIPTGLLRGLGMEESHGLNHFDERGNIITSGTGPRGAFQFTKATARQYGIDRDNPMENIVGAAAYLRDNYEALKQDIDDDDERWLASAVAHNRGLGAVKGMVKNRRFEPSGKDSGNGGDTPTYARRIAENWAKMFDGKQSAPNNLQPNSYADAPADVPQVRMETGSLPVQPLPPTPEEIAAFEKMYPQNPAAVSPVETLGQNSPVKPVPESAFTLSKQIESALLPDSPKAAVLLTEPSQIINIPQEQKKFFTPVLTPNGTVLVNNEKALKLGLAQPLDIIRFVNQKGFAALIGKAEDVGNATSDGLAVRTETPDGKELSTSIVTTPEAAAAQKQIDAQSFPSGVSTVLDTQGAIAKREAETLPTQPAVLPVENASVYTKREIKQGEPFYNFEKEGKEGDKIYLGIKDGKHHFQNPDGDTLALDENTKQLIPVGESKRAFDAEKNEYTLADQANAKGGVRRLNKDGVPFIFTPDGKIREENPAPPETIDLNDGSKAVYAPEDRAGLKDNQYRYIAPKGEPLVMTVSEADADGKPTMRTELEFPSEKRIQKTVVTKARPNQPKRAPREETDVTIGEDEPESVTKAIEAGKIKIGSDEYTVDPTPIVSVDAVQVRITDKDGETYFYNPETGEKTDESFAKTDVEFKIPLVSKNLRSNITPKAARELYKQSVAKKLFETRSIPASDTEAYFGERKIPITDIGTNKEAGDDFFYTSGIDAEDKTHTVTRRNTKDIQEFSDKRRNDLKKRAIDIIASGKGFAPDEAAYFRANDVDVDSIRKTFPDVASTEKAQRAIYAQNRDKEAADYTREMELEGARPRRPEIDLYSSLRAARSMGWIDQKQFDKTVADYSQLRTDIAKEIKDEKLWKIWFTSPTKGERDVKGVKVSVSDDEIDGRIDIPYQQFGSIPKYLQFRKGKEQAETARLERIAKKDWTTYLTESAVEMPKIFVKGVANMVIGDTLRGIGLYAKDIDDRIYGAENNPRKTAGDYGTYQLGETFTRGLNYLLETDDDYAGEFVQGKLTQGISSTVAMMLPARIAKYPRLALGFLSQMQMGSSGYQEALESGATEPQAQLAGTLIGFTGWSELAGLGKAFNRLNTGKGGTVWRKFFREAAIEGAKEIPEEIIQEGGQTAAANFIAKMTYDPRRALDKGLYEAMLVAGITAPLASSGVTMLNFARNRAAIKKLIKEEQQTGIVIKSYGDGEVTAFGQKVKETSETKPLVELFDNSRRGIAQIQNKLEALGKVKIDKLTETQAGGLVAEVTALNKELGSLRKRQAAIALDIVEKSGIAKPVGTVGETLGAPTTVSEPEETKVDLPNTEINEPTDAPEQTNNADDAQNTVSANTVNQPVVGSIIKTDVRGKSKSGKVIEEKNSQFLVDFEDGSRSFVQKKKAEFIEENSNVKNQPEVDIKPEVAEKAESLNTSENNVIEAAKSEQVKDKNFARSEPLSKTSETAQIVQEELNNDSNTEVAEAVKVGDEVTVDINGETRDGTIEKEVGTQNVVKLEDGSKRFVPKTKTFQRFKLPAKNGVAKTSENMQNNMQNSPNSNENLISATEVAHEAATSPFNDLPEPTKAQIEAGNYKKGHINISGLNISVENPTGSQRKGVDRDGKPWSVEMQHHYGYIKRTVGADTENIDVFVKDHTPQDFAGDVYIVDQVHPDTGAFDEHKVMLGFGSETEATEAYASNYAKDWKGLQKITAMPFNEFKKWTNDGQSAPVAKSVKQHANKESQQTPVVLTPTSENSGLVANEKVDNLSTSGFKVGDSVEHISGTRQGEVVESRDGLAVRYKAKGANQQVKLTENNWRKTETDKNALTDNVASQAENKDTQVSENKANDTFGAQNTITDNNTSLSDDSAHKRKEKLLPEKERKNLEKAEKLANRNPRAKTSPNPERHSLWQYVKYSGGIRPDVTNSKRGKMGGELERLSVKQGGKIGVVNKNSRFNDEAMAFSAWEAGYLNDVFETSADVNGDTFLQYVEEDMRGAKHFARTNKIYEEIEAELNARPITEDEEAELAKISAFESDEAVRAVFQNLIKTLQIDDNAVKILQDKGDEYGITEEIVDSIYRANREIALTYHEIEDVAGETAGVSEDASQSFAEEVLDETDIADDEDVDDSFDFADEETSASDAKEETAFKQQSSFDQTDLFGNKVTPKTEQTDLFGTSEITADGEANLKQETIDAYGAKTANYLAQLEKSKDKDVSRAAQDLIDARKLVAAKGEKAVQIVEDASDALDLFTLAHQQQNTVAEQLSQRRLDAADYSAQAVDFAKFMEAGKFSSVFGRALSDAKTEVVKPTEKIEDFGEKIGGAKKDLAKQLNDVTGDDIKDKPLSKSFPRPDFAKLVQDGIITKEGAKFLNFLYNNIPAKPRKSYKLNGWVKTVESAISTFKDLIESDTTKNIDFTEKLTESTASPYLKRDYEIYSKTMDALGFPESNPSLGGYEIRKFDNRYSKNGDKLGDRFTIVKGNFIVKDFDSLDDAASGLKTILYGNKEAVKTTKFDLYQDRNTKEYFIGKKGATGVVRVMEGFKTSKEGRAFLTDKQIELENIWNGFKVKANERRAENRERIGTDWRGGENITPEKFGETFGFRGVEFGNWLNNAERQTSINNAYDALMDMAAALKISPKAVSLNGELGLGFGSRGSGGVNPAAAHYERDKIVINLTKTNGAGSLGHEWWHALDNYFSRMRGNAEGFLTDSPRRRMNRDGSMDVLVRPEMIEAFKGVMDAIKSSEMPKRSAELDKTRTKLYWSTPIEMSARSFENFLISKLAETKEQNDYLANFKEIGLWASENGLDLDNYPYPLEDESENISNAFQNFFDTVEEETDENGNVALKAAQNAEMKKWDKIVGADLGELPIAMKTALDSPDSYRVSLNAEAAEFLRRVYQELRYKRTKQQNFELPFYAMFDILKNPMSNREFSGKAVAFIRAQSKDAKDLGYSPEEIMNMNNLADAIEIAAKNGKGGFIFYVDDAYLPEEELHRAGFMAFNAAVSRDRFADDLSDDPLVQQYKQVYASYLREFPESMRDAVAWDETAAVIARGGAENELGASEAEQVKYLDRFFESMAKRLKEKGIDVATALKNYDAVKESKVSEQIKRTTERYGTPSSRTNEIKSNGKSDSGRGGRPGSETRADSAAVENDQTGERGESFLGESTVKRTGIASLPETLRQNGYETEQKEYEVQSNADTRRAAVEMADASDAEQLIIEALTDGRELGATETATALELVKRLSREANATENAEIRAAKFAKVAEIADLLDERLREAGRFIQAVSLLEHLSPDMVLLTAKRRMNRYNPDAVMTDAQAADLIEKAKDLEAANDELNKLKNKYKRIEKRFDKYRKENRGQRKSRKTGDKTKSKAREAVIKKLSAGEDAILEKFKGIFGGQVFGQKAAFDPLSKVRTEILTFVSRLNLSRETADKLTIRHLNFAERKIVEAFFGSEVKENYKFTLDKFAVRNILSGNKLEQGEIPITPTDFAYIPGVLENPDYVFEDDKTRMGLNVVVFTKRFNGYVIVVEEVRTGKKELATVGLRKFEKGSEFLPRPKLSTPEAALPYEDDDTKDGIGIQDFGDNNVQKAANLGVADTVQLSPEQIDELAQFGALEMARGFHKLGGEVFADRLRQIFGDEIEPFASEIWAKSRKEYRSQLKEVRKAAAIARLEDANPDLSPEEVIELYEDSQSALAEARRIANLHLKKEREILSETVEKTEKEEKESSENEVELKQPRETPNKGLKKSSTGKLSGLQRAVFDKALNQKIDEQTRIASILLANPKTRDYNYASNVLKDKFGISNEQAETAIEAGARFLKTVRDNIDNARQATKPALTKEEISALDAAHKRQMKASNDLNNRINAVAKMPVGKLGIAGHYAGRLRRIYKGFIVSALSTAFPNLYGGSMTIAVKTATDAIDLGIQKTQNKLGVKLFAPSHIAPEVGFADVVALKAFQGVVSKRMAEGILDRFPAQFQQLFGRYNADIEAINDSVKIPYLTKAFEGTEWLVDKANIPNQLQEFAMRRAEFLRQMYRIAAEKGKSLDDIYNARSIEEAFSEEDITKAVSAALEATYAAPPSNKTIVGQAVRKYNEKMNHSLWALAAPVEPAIFAGFMYNAARFTSDYMPPIHIVKHLFSKEQYTTQNAAQFTVGVGMFAIAMGLVSAFGGDDDRWYVLNIAGVPIDVRRYAPFASYIYLANLAHRAYEGRTPMERWEDAVEQFTAFNTRAVIGNPFIEVIGLAMRGMSGKDDRWLEREGQLIKGLAGRTVAAPLTPLRVLKDLAAQFIASEGKDYDYSESPFMAELHKKIPLSSLMWQYAPKKNFVTGAEKQKRLPALNIVGVSVQPEINRQQTVAEEAAMGMREPKRGESEKLPDERRRSDAIRDISKANEKGIETGRAVKRAVDGGLISNQFGEILKNNKGKLPLEIAIGRSQLTLDEKKWLLPKADEQEKPVLEKIIQKAEENKLKRETPKSIVEKLKSADTNKTVELYDEYKDDFDPMQKTEFIAKLRAKADNAAKAGTLTKEELETVKKVIPDYKPRFALKPPKPPKPPKPGESMESLKNFMVN
ncbi:MAG TPA: LPD5 domain-containing protein [Pyrinomonadaceae bacterium]|nr:LPD5 domain-containing protein [Pyrinomonadaceae bacterium]